MAPTKNTRSISNSKQVTGVVLTMPHSLNPMPRKNITRQAIASITNQNVADQNIDLVQTRGKRKAENSPIKNDKVKRSAFGNLTNNSNKVQTMSGILHTEEVVKQQQQQQQLTKKAQIAQNIGLKTTLGAVTRQAHAKLVKQRSGKKVLGDQTNKQTNASLVTVTKLQEISVTKSKKIKTVKSQQPPQAPLAVQPTVLKVINKPTRRISNEFNKTEESLYMSALEDVDSCDSLRLSGNFETARKNSQILQEQKKQLPSQQLQTTTATTKTTTTTLSSVTTTTATTTKEQLQQLKKKDLEKVQINTKQIKEAAKQTQIEQQRQLNLKNKENKTDKSEDTDINIYKYVPKPRRVVPYNVEDFDKANWNDPLQISHYAMDIFDYLKERETEFPIDDYMKRQIHLSDWMRSLLVDWMVEVQETFELNHETLYLAVKIVDLYLCREIINKDKLQLLGAAALFIACKYDERQPPLVDDFLFICDGAYKRNEVIKMEMKTLRIIGYDLGIPLSYRFLRRYARCAKISMPTLTLARYILELSLMDYTTVNLSDSKLACAAMYMALRLHGIKNPWTETLQHYSGYKLEEFAMIIPILNMGLHRKPKETIQTIRNKYSHRIFHEVAKVKLMSNEQLFEQT